MKDNYMCKKIPNFLIHWICLASMFKVKNIFGNRIQQMVCKNLNFNIFYFTFGKIFIINVYTNIISVTALTSTLPDESNKVSVDTSEVRSTTALSVLYNSEYINGKYNAFRYASIFKIIDV